ncbi:spore coat protein [Paenibacillus mucilaginosus 3016]|uniref:Spore coat protein n=1 Tax=Paenibacillus mucilaginosus 3016 TaxID=1116391 RepID=H6NBV9_9BACL|nr:glycosyltransferase family 4 protein [Paenibacillus mucilaginosus]AFC27910.1 spore coat protein [Paenibacillus mucilaginosus 3016]WFA16773.1 glycosyltransferase family 1 protein [Paenibacillus mucilaginosus]
MRILIVAPEQLPVPTISGSVEICILAAARQLAKRHQVTVISREGSGLPRRTVEGSLTIERVRTGSPERYLRAVLHAVKGRHYDVIQVDNRPRFIPPFKSQFPGTPVVLFLHSLNFVSKKRIPHRRAAACLAAADRVLVNSTSLRREIVRRFPGASGKIRRITLGVDPARFSPSGRTGKSRTGRRSYTVLYTGRLIRRKGIPVLMRAVRLVARSGPKQVQLVVAGGSGKPAYAAQLKRLARGLGIRARFLGTVPHGRMPGVYAQADCFVCPSQGHEAFGLVNAEAMACEIPVIAAANGGIRELVRHRRTGLLVKAYRRPEGYAAAIRVLMGSPELAGRLAAAGRREVLRRFTWARTARLLSRAYEAVRSKQER